MIETQHEASADEFSLQNSALFQVKQNEAEGLVESVTKEIKKRKRENTGKKKERTKTHLRKKERKHT